MTESRRPVAIEDLYEIRLVADPNISPDARKVAFVVTTVDKEQDGYRAAIWMAATDGSEEPFQFTSGRKKDFAPRWSPDGRYLAFLSDRSGSAQVWAMESAGGEPWQVTEGKHPAGEISWSGDSRTIAYVSKVEPEDSDEQRSDARVVRSLVYKMDGEGFFDGKRKHVHLIDVEGGEPRRVTEGDWDCLQPALAPDGRTLAFVSNRADDRESTRRADIWTSDLATGAVTRVTDEDGRYATPAWSPDGSQLAYVGSPEAKPFGPTTLTNLYVWDKQTGEARGLLSSLDREPNNSSSSDSRFHVPAQLPVWDADGSRLLTPVSDQGSIHLYSCPLNGAPVVLAGGERDITSFTVARDGTIAFAASTMTQPYEVFVRRPKGGEAQLSNINGAWLEGVQLPALEEVRFTGKNGVEIHGWLLKPPGFAEGRKYPAIVTIHGGPHGMYGVAFYHEMQVHAGRGYVVFFTNPRGSTGYGQQFVAGALGDWGGADYDDVMASVDYLESLDYIDANRLGVTGTSYGGYMVNWIVTQSDRFKAAVSQASTCNRFSQYGISDINATFNDWEFRGTPYDNPTHYMERSPISHVAKVQTPVLLLHSENDHRCPIAQGEEFFTALKKLGKEVEFVRYPEESHGLSRSGKPTRRVDRLERICGWFDAHV